MPNRSSFSTHEDYLQWYRDYRKRNPELREYTRKYNNEWRHQNGYAAEIRAKKKFPEKERSRSLAQYSLRVGHIKRKNCKICGSEKSHMHHEDYSKPLEVIWLCPLHHAERHKEIDTPNHQQKRVKIKR